MHRPSDVWLKEVQFEIYESYATITRVLGYLGHPCYTLKPIIVTLNIRAETAKTEEGAEAKKAAGAGDAISESQRGLGFTRSETSDILPLRRQLTIVPLLQKNAVHVRLSTAGSEEVGYVLAQKRGWESAFSAFRRTF